MNQPPACGNCRPYLPTLLRSRAQAAAQITGSADFPALSGTVRFYQTRGGVVVCAEIVGLPCSKGPCQERIFGFHIHQGTDCGGSQEVPFANALSHYDQQGCQHPDHAGDLPPLFGNQGTALSLFLTNRFTVDEVLGRTVLIHDHPDDFTTQPAGQAGTKIACGVIRRTASPCRP